MERRDIYVSLLRDIDEIADKNDIKYIVIGKTSLFVNRDKNIGLSPNRIDIAMTQGDAEKFRSYFLEHKNEYPERFIESMLDNHKMNAHWMRFGDTNTFELRTKELNSTRSNNFINNSLHVNIRFIERPLSIKSAWLLKRKSTERLWKIYNFRFAGYSLWFVRLCVCFANLFMNLITFGRFRFKRYYSARKTFAIERWDDIHKFDNVKVANKIFPGEIFNGINRIRVEEGLSVPVLEDYDKYLSILSESKGFDPDKIQNANKADSRLASVYFNEDELKKSTRYEDCVSEIRKKREEVFKTRARSLKYRQRVKRIKVVVAMTEDEVKLREHYTKMQPDIVKLFKEEQYEQLERVFEPLKNSLFYYASRGMTYSISETIDNIFDDVYLRLNCRSQIKSIRKLRKKRHYA